MSMQSVMEEMIKKWMRIAEKMMIKKWTRTAELETMMIKKGMRIVKTMMKVVQGTC